MPSFKLVLGLTFTVAVVGAEAAIASSGIGWITFPAQTVQGAGSQVRGEFKFPKDAKERVPAVVIIHNAGGLQDRTGAEYVKY